MLYKIAHWRGYQPPVPEAIKVAEPCGKSSAQWEIEVDDLHEFVEKHGMIQLRKVKDGRWMIFVTDHGWGQR